MNKFIVVYASNPQELSKVAEKAMQVAGATGWARTETAFQGRGEYTIKLKGCSR